MNTFNACFENPLQDAISELNRIVLKKENMSTGFRLNLPYLPEPVEVKFQDAVNADKEMSAKEAYELHELIEEENERILRHGDRGGFEEG